MLKFHGKKFYLQVFAIFGALIATVASSDELLMETIRLPNTTHPFNYKIHIITNIHREILEFEGTCEILINVFNTTDRIVLHARNLTIENVQMSDYENKQASMEKLNFELIEKADFLVLKRKNATNFQKNTMIVIAIKYTGIINKNGLGFQTFIYRNKNGKNVTGAYTVFEADLARSALPCYDEPKFKARFQLQITHGSNLTAVSTMPQDGDIVKDALNNGTMVTTCFKPSDRMSVYLLSFMITDFQRYDNKYAKLGFPQSVYTNDGHLIGSWNIFNETNWALETIEKLFNVTYDFEKLDTVIFPKMFGENGYENLGLVFYSNHFVCECAPCIHDYTAKRNVIYHEMLHQWFGNLVTVEWWQYFWLHEGFTTYYAFVMEDLQAPKDRAIERFRLNSCRTLLNDQTKGILSDYVELGLSDIFNNIQYKKAGCIIQMFEDALGTEIFRQAISYYFRANYKSTVREDHLFDAIQYTLLLRNISIANNSMVHKVMKTWTHSVSMPIILVERDYTDENSSILTISQLTENNFFYIPITFATTENYNNAVNNAIYWMQPVDSAIIDLKTLNITLKPNDWLIVNVNASGFYTVLYDNNNVKILSETMKKNPKFLNALDRAQLYGVLTVDEYDMLLLKNDFNGFISIPRLELIDCLKCEDDALVLLAAIDNILKYRIYIGNDYKMFRQYLKNVFETLYTRFLERTQSDITADINEAMMFQQLKGLAHDLNIQEALNDRSLPVAFLKNFQRMKDQIYDLQTWTRTVCRAVKNSTIEEFNEVLKFFNTAQNSSESLTCDQWLGLLCTQHEANFLKLFDDFFNNSLHDCNCKTEFITNFTMYEHTDNWKSAWSKINDAYDELKKENDCEQILCNDFQNNMKKFPLNNLKKFKGCLRQTKPTDEGEAEENKIRIWLKEKLKQTELHC